MAKGWGWGKGPDRYDRADQARRGVENARYAVEDIGAAAGEAAAKVAKKAVKSPPVRTGRDVSRRIWGGKDVSGRPRR